MDVGQRTFWIVVNIVGDNSAPIDALKHVAIAILGGKLHRVAGCIVNFGDISSRVVAVGGRTPVAISNCLRSVQSIIGEKSWLFASSDGKLFALRPVSVCVLTYRVPALIFSDDLHTRATEIKPGSSNARLAGAGLVGRGENIENRLVRNVVLDISFIAEFINFTDAISPWVESLMLNFAEVIRDCECLPNCCRLSVRTISCVVERENIASDGIVARRSYR